MEHCLNSAGPGVGSVSCSQARKTLFVEITTVRVTLKTVCVQCVGYRGLSINLANWPNNIFCNMCHVPWKWKLSCLSTAILA